MSLKINTPTAMNKTQGYTKIALHLFEIPRYARNDAQALANYREEAGAAVSSIARNLMCTAAPASFMFSTATLSFRMERSGMRNLKSILKSN